MSNIINLLIDINTYPLDCLSMPVLVKQETDKASSEDVEADNMTFCISGWLEVLNEHGDIFDKGIISNIAEDIKQLMDYRCELPSVFNHGDYHLNNILKDNKGQLVACDWQNAGVGHASDDLSFFLSRASADGLKQDIDKSVSEYCRLFTRKSGIPLRVDDVSASMSKSDLGLSFYCWHEYLHQSSTERIKIVFEKMVNAYKFMKSIC